MKTTLKHLKCSVQEIVDYELTQELFDWWNAQTQEKYKDFLW